MNRPDLEVKQSTESKASEGATLAIVRAFGDEPVVMEVIETTHTYVMVRRLGAARGIRLPPEMVFSYDSVVDCMNIGDDMSGREQFWIGRKPFATTCNRYQNVLSSIHGEEERSESDPEGIEGRDGE